MGWCTYRHPGIPYPYAVCEYQGPPRAGAHMGILDAHVWTGHWFRPFQLYILTWDRPSWAGAYVGIQDFHIHMQSVNIKDPQGLVHMWMSWTPMGVPVIGSNHSHSTYGHGSGDHGLVHVWASWNSMCGPLTTSEHSNST